MAGCLVGCGHPAGDRVAFSGSVSQGVRPVVQGTISFLPAEGHPGGPAANTRIESGRYRFTSADGPVPGPHRVLINVLGQETKAAGQGTAPSAKRHEFDVSVTTGLDFRTDFDLEAP